MLLNVEQDDKFLWLYEDIRKNLIFQIFAIVAFVALVAYIIYKIKTKNRSKPHRETIGPKRIGLGIMIYILVISLYLLFFLFQLLTGLDFMTMGIVNYLVKYFELIILFMILLTTNTVIIVKTKWFSKRL